MVPPVVDVEWWSARRDDPRQANPVLADVRWYLDGRSGRAAYDAGHLPGAVFVDLDRWLAAHAEPQLGRHPLPAPEVFVEGMSRLGIADDDVVVAYDDEGGVIAARLVWMLRSTGRAAAVLDGGLPAYEGPLETTAPERALTSFSVRPWPADRLASLDDAADPVNLVLDARNADRYRGDVEPVDPRAGHIPGARNLPCRSNLDPSGRFLPVKTLRQRFAAVGVRAGAEVVSYCGSGVTACHNLIAMEHAGLGTGRLYPGSWSQWSSMPERAVAVGDEA
jgi:thiosulfate/3-mercaptopyruvate sulfurtransferase